ncbi:unnamed protein product [Pleuronectes platessa]|uniref:Uncharacterized protein n=1 Tax=Pleuronectes platessa TaxID=8262 RepID=A0A9N7VW61_PLEPL|nr:unnamed protein product [Pleuronectes platessa]
MSTAKIMVSASDASHVMGCLHDRPMPYGGESVNKRKEKKKKKEKPESLHPLTTASVDHNKKRHHSEMPTSKLTFHKKKKKKKKKEKKRKGGMQYGKGGLHPHYLLIPLLLLNTHMRAKTLPPHPPAHAPSPTCPPPHSLKENHKHRDNDATIAASSPLRAKQWTYSSTSTQGNDIMT